jgi:small basic protein
MDQFEAPSDYTGIAENFFYARWDCLAYYVKVLGLFLQEQIPYRASYNVAVVARFFQPEYYIYRFFINIINADPVLIDGIYYGLSYQPAVLFAVSVTQSHSFPARE